MQNDRYTEDGVTLGAENGARGTMFPYIAEGLRSLAVPVTSLVPDAANARKHNEKNIEAIKASLSRFGQRAPIVVQRKGMVVRAGNGRLEAAKAIGWTHIAAVIVDEESADAVAFAIADNRTAELAEWDNETLANLLNTMGEEDLKYTGFDDADLRALLSDLTPDVVEDTTPEAKPNPISKTGDLWELGDHHLLCGDSTSADDVKRLMGGVKAGLMVTDPPYGVEYDADWRNHALRSYGSPSDGRAVGKVTNDDRADWRDAWKLFDGDVAYVWHAGVHSPVVAESLDVCGFDRRALIVWAKQQMVIGRGDYHHQHEPCWYCVRKGKGGHRTDDRTQTTLWKIDKPHKSETGHSTQKPIECMAIPMQNHTIQTVYDPFLGSGTTLIAAEQLGRKCYGMEISPQYCDVIVTRWEKLTGKKATCGGKTIEELAEERGVSV